MATRSIVIVEHGNTTQKLYHHYDGYLTGVGLELLMSITKYSDVSHGSASYLLKYLPRSYEETGDLHGDIEFIYKLKDGDGIKLFYKPVEEGKPIGERIEITPELMVGHLLHELKSTTESLNINNLFLDHLERMSEIIKDLNVLYLLKKKQDIS